MTKETKTEKIPDLLARIRECLNEGQYRFSKHAFDMGKERFLSIPNVLEVLNNGYHAKASCTLMSLKKSCFLWELQSKSGYKNIILKNTTAYHPISTTKLKIFIINLECRVF